MSVERKKRLQRSGYDISPKTSNGTLKEFAFGKWDSSSRNTVALDMVRNVRELVGEERVDWDFVLGIIRHGISQKPADRAGMGKSFTRFSRNDAIAVSAPVIGTLAKDMGCSMDAPAMVYASGLYFSREAEKIISAQNKRLTEIQEGTTTFLDEEKKAEVIRKAVEVVSKFTVFKQALDESVSMYAQDTLASPLNYTNVLSVLTLDERKKLDRTRRLNIIRLLKEGEIEEAHNEARRSSLR